MAFTLKDLKELERKKKEDDKRLRMHFNNLIHTVDKLSWQQSAKDEQGNLIDPDERTQLESIVDYYEHRLNLKSGQVTNRFDLFDNQICCHCGAKGEKRFRVKSFLENRQKVAFLFKVCPDCGRWEKHHQTKMQRRRAAGSGGVGRGAGKRTRTEFRAAAQALGAKAEKGGEQEMEMKEEKTPSKTPETKKTKKHNDITKTPQSHTKSTGSANKSRRKMATSSSKLQKFSIDDVQKLRQMLGKGTP